MSSAPPTAATKVYSRLTKAWAGPGGVYRFVATRACSGRFPSPGRSLKLYRCPGGAYGVALAKAVGCPIIYQAYGSGPPVGPQSTPGALTGPAPDTGRERPAAGGASSFRDLPRAVDHARSCPRSPPGQCALVRHPHLMAAPHYGTMSSALQFVVNFQCLCPQ